MPINYNESQNYFLNLNTIIDGESGRKDGKFKETSHYLGI